MANANIDLQNANSKELYWQGVRAYIVHDYGAAVKAFSKACELLTQEHGSETHSSLGNVYLYYGKSLLELSRKETDALGEGIFSNSEEEELTDLQIAWEVLELAKQIFTENASTEQKSLAETYIILGEVSLESGNFSLGIKDMLEGLKIQKTLYGNDSRKIAETHYKLGAAFATNGQISEAIGSFTSSLTYIRNKLQSLEKEEKESNAEEIDELKSLIPEIEERIADMKNLETEVANKISSLDQKREEKESPEAASSSSSKGVNDISHLVKRKRQGEDVQADSPAKKPSP